MVSKYLFLLSVNIRYKLLAFTIYKSIGISIYQYIRLRYNKNINIKIFIKIRNHVLILLIIITCDVMSKILVEVTDEMKDKKEKYFSSWKQLITLGIKWLEERNEINKQKNEG